MKTLALVSILAVAALFSVVTPRAAMAQDYQSYKYQSDLDQFQYNFRPSANGVCRDYTRNIHDGGGRRVVYGTVCPGTDGRWHMVNESNRPHKNLRVPTRTFMTDTVRRQAPYTVSYE